MGIGIACEQLWQAGARVRAYAYVYAHEHAMHVVNVIAQADAVLQLLTCQTCSRKGYRAGAPEMVYVFRHQLMCLSTLAAPIARGQ